VGVENACIQFWRTYDPAVLTIDIDTTKKPLKEVQRKCPDLKKKTLIPPTIRWGDNKLNHEEHYIIQPGNLNHTRVSPRLLGV